MWGDGGCGDGVWGDGGCGDGVWGDGGRVIAGGRASSDGEGIGWFAWH